jgi:hypothetical protein
MSMRGAMPALDVGKYWASVLRFMVQALKRGMARRLPAAR